MEPKQQSQLDPALQATYDRVMNTPVSPPVQPVPPPMPPSPSVHVAPTPPLSSPQPPTQHAHAFVASEQKRKGGISIVTYILGSILFFVVYILFWIRFFHISIPLLR